MGLAFIPGRREEVEKRTGKPVEGGSIIVEDLKGLGWKHFYRPGLPLLRRLAKIDADHYPESLHRLFVVNAPVFWSFLKPMLDPVTVSKLQVLGSNALEVISKDMPKDVIPLYLGGPHQCSTCVPDGGVFPGGAEDYTEITVGARDKHVQKVDVEKEGSLIAWDFKTENFDIGFGVFFVNGGDLEEVILPLTRYQSISPIQDKVVATRKGTYSLIFDNSHSFFRKKQLKISIAVEPPPEEEKALTASTPSLTASSTPSLASPASERNNDSARKKKKKKKGKKEKSKEEAKGKEVKEQ